MKIKNLLAAFLGLLLFVGSAHGYTREEVKKRGFLRCGVSTGSPGFSSVDSKGRWTGLDVDICRAVAAATLGNSEKVEFLPLAQNESFTALLSGKVDILSRHLTWTFTRDSALGVHFAGVSYYDVQGILVAEDLNAETSFDLENVKICSPVGSPGQENLTDYFSRRKVRYRVVPYESLDLAVKGFAGKNCNVISLQQSQLHGLRLGLTDPESAVVLPDVISKEPLGPVVRRGDDVWLNIVKWSLYAMINAEELEVTSKNIKEMKISNKLAVRRLFGLEGSGGKGMGIDDDWAERIIEQVGNYGEVFERNFGPGSAMKVERGLNRLWNRGGLQYAPPMR